MAEVLRQMNRIVTSRSLIQVRENASLTCPSQYPEAECFRKRPLEWAPHYDEHLKATDGGNNAIIAALQGIAPKVEFSFDRIVGFPLRKSKLFITFSRLTNTWLRL